jgi:hypothetical protein
MLLIHYHDIRSEFKLLFKTLCDSYGIKCKLTGIKNPQANEILDRVHQMIMEMHHTAEINMANTVSENPFALPITQYSKSHQAQLF